MIHINARSGCYVIFHVCFAMRQMTADMENSSGMAMSKDWIEKLKKRLPPRLGHAISDAEQAIDSLTLHVHLSRWHPISTAPFNQDLELRVVEAEKIATLKFPCRQTNTGEWINTDLGLPVKIQPVEWRVWQHRQSPHPHHSRVQIDDKSALMHTHDHSAKPVRK